MKNWTSVTLVAREGPVEVKDFPSVKAALKYALYQLRYYREMMGLKP
jgi:hypothetical protein